MNRVVLIHWNAAEGQQRAQSLCDAGFVAEALVPQGIPALRALRDQPPAAIVIDLTRVPSQGAAVAIALRQQKRTRHVPIVFVGGQPSKVDRVRRQIPDAAYSDWPQVETDLREAIRNPPASPVTPGTMDPYRGVPLVRKLGIGAGAVVALDGAPEGFAETLGDLPEGVRLRTDLRGGPALVLLFARSRRNLEQLFPPASRAVAPGGGLWILWPKKSSGLASDLTQAEVRRCGLEAGWVDFKICAVDATWSGLRFSRRR